MSEGIFDPPLLLLDQDGAVFRVPRSLVEPFRLTPAEVRAVIARARSVDLDWLGAPAELQKEWEEALAGSEVEGQDELLVVSALANVVFIGIRIAVLAHRRAEAERAREGKPGALPCADCGKPLAPLEAYFLARGRPTCERCFERKSA